MNRLYTLTEIKEAILEGQKSFEYCIIDKNDIDPLGELIDKSFKRFLGADTKDTAIEVKIYEIKDDINIPLKDNPNAMANANIGDELIVSGKNVWVKNWDDDNNENEYVLAIFDNKFVEANTTFFRNV